MKTGFIFSIVTNAQNCQELYQQHLKTDLKLSYKAFDQTMGKGFRSLINNNGNMCHKEVADLIEKSFKSIMRSKAHSDSILHN
ncbi:MAG: hypothetical protein JKX98_02435 [Alcanivoracaceae bacterium]|nr:hypothetical protein [Alcanivoracaceae bacterium]